MIFTQQWRYSLADYEMVNNSRSLRSVQLSLVWLDRLLALDVIEIAQLLQIIHLRWLNGYFTRVIEEVVWKPGIEVVSFLNVGDILRTELETKRFNVRSEVTGFPAADDREYVGCL